MFTPVPSAAGVDHEVSAAESAAAAEYVRGCGVEWKPVWISVSGQEYSKEHPGARGRETSQAATAAESSAAAKGKNNNGSVYIKLVSISAFQGP